MCSRNTGTSKVICKNVWKSKFKEIVTCVANCSTPMYGTMLCIRIRSDPKLLAGSGKNPSGSGTEQLWIRNEIGVKLLIMSNLTHLQVRNTKIKLVKNIRKNPKEDPDPKPTEK